MEQLELVAAEEPAECEETKLVAPPKPGAITFSCHSGGALIVPFDTWLPVCDSRLELCPRSRVAWLGR
jgi:hypothetical protein